MPSDNFTMSENSGSFVMQQRQDRFDAIGDLIVGPPGPPGPQGETGATPNISIGTVTTLPAGSSATATITGTEEAPVLNLGIPQGQKGDPGEVTQVEFDELKNAFEITDYSSIELTWLANYSWDKRDRNSSPRSASGFACANAVSVAAGEKYLLKNAYVTGNQYKIAYIVYNEDYSAIITQANVESSAGTYDYDITIPDGGAHLCINCNSGTESARLRTELKKLTEVYPDMDAVVAKVDSVDTEFNELTDITNNLFIPEISAVSTQSGITITPVNKSTIKLNGTATANININCEKLPSGTYYFYSDNLIPSFVSLRYGTSFKVWNNETALTLTEETEIYLRIGNGAVLNNYLFSAMISNTEHFEPYVESGSSAIDKTARAMSDNAFKVYTGSIIDDNVENERLYNAAKRQINNPSVSTLELLWFSDIHNYTTNANRIIQLSEKLETENIICTGDIVADYVTSTAFDNWNSVEGTDEILIVPGNHDWYSNSGHTSYVSLADMYANLFSNASNWGVSIGTNVPYWYKDYEASKVRLIGIDSFLVYVDSSAYTTMTTWLESVLSDAKTNNFHVIIMNHEPVYTNNADIIDCGFSDKLNPYSCPVSSAPMDYEAEQQSLDTISGIVDDFITAGGHFVCYLFGHIHNDFIGKLVNYPDQMFVVIGCANTTIDTVNDVDRTGKGRDLVNAIVVDTATNTAKVIRFGADKTATANRREAICFNYATGAVL